MPDKPRALRAIKEILRPGGRLAVFEFTPYKGIASVLNPLLYFSLSPAPANMTGVFREAPKIRRHIEAAFPEYSHNEFYSGSHYLGIARKSLR